MTVSLGTRLWTYQAERFPLKQTVPLLGVFSAASIAVSATLAGRDLPHWGAFVTGFVLALTLFFQMRVCDEYKDLDDDRRYRPDRPIPRGLVSLRLVLLLGLLSAGITALAAGLWSRQMLWLLGAVWVWLALMSLEFGAPAHLKARPVLYLLSHMAIMPLIDLLLTGVEWLPQGHPPAGLWLFLALSFVNGCVLEIGRKLWASENEIDGVDTYSRLWGPKMAARVWVICAALSCAILIAVGFAIGTPGINAIIGGTGLIVLALTARRYMRQQTIKAQKSVDLMAGLWVFGCYVVAGFAPFIKAIVQ